MVDMDEIVEVMNDVGISNDKIDKVRSAARKVDLSAPEKLYFFLNLADVNDVKTIARAIIGVYGEEGRKFMQQKVEDNAGAKHVTKNKQNFTEEAMSAKMDKFYDQMMKSIQMKQMMEMAGLSNNGNNSGGGQDNYPMAEEPVIENGRMVVDDEGNVVTRKVPYDPKQGNGQNGMTEMMFSALLRMMENSSNSNNGNTQAMTELVKVVAQNALQNDNDKMVELQKEMLNTKKEVAQKEQELRNRDLQEIMGSVIDKVDKLEQKTSKDPLDELERTKQKIDRLKDLGLGEKKTEEDWEREKERMEMENERKLRERTMDTFEKAINSIGNPIGAALGQGLKESMLNKGAQPNDEEMNKMMNRIQQQKQQSRNPRPQGNPSPQPSQDISNEMPDIDNAIQDMENASDASDEEIEVVG